MNPRIDSLKKMLGGPRDGALLRFSLGNEYLKAGDASGALAAYERGIAVAETKGDIQAAKEMKVFARRLRKAPGA